MNLKNDGNDSVALHPLTKYIFYREDVCSGSCAGDGNVGEDGFAMTTSKSISPLFFIL